MFNRIVLTSQIQKNHPDTFMLRKVLCMLADNTLVMRGSGNEVTVSKTKNQFQIEFVDGTVIVVLPPSKPMDPKKIDTEYLRKNPRQMELIEFKFEVGPEKTVFRREATWKLKRLVNNFAWLFGTRMLIPWTAAVQRHIEKFKIEPPSNFTNPYGVFGCYSAYDSLAQLALQNYTNPVQLGRGKSYTRHEMYAEMHEQISKSYVGVNFVAGGTEATARACFAWINSSYDSDLFNWKVSKLFLEKDRVSLAVAGMSWSKLKSLFKRLDDLVWISQNPTTSLLEVFGEHRLVHKEIVLSSSPKISWDYEVLPLKKYLALSKEFQGMMLSYFPHTVYDWFYPSLLPLMANYKAGRPIKKVNKFAFGA